MFNLPAAVIVLLVSTILVIGIRESAGFNTAIVVVKVAVLLLFIAFGVKYIEHGELASVRSRRTPASSVSSAGAACCAARA